MVSLRLAITAAALAAAGSAGAQPIVVADSGDSAWVLAATLLIFVAALPGLALFHARERGAPAGIALFAAAAAASLVFAVIGYSLAFGDGSTLLGGTGNVMLANLADLRGGDATISETVFALFELAVALFAVGILATSVADRVRLAWLAGFAALWTLLVYVPVARWLWGGGWLADLGALDFGGGIVVQATAGTAALVIAVLLGRTRGVEERPEWHFSLGGVALIWAGWFGILGGAAFAAGDDAASAMLNAQFAASAAVLTGLVLARRKGSPSIDGVGTAAIAGLAAISAGAGFVGPGGAMALGIIGALAAWGAGTLVARLELGGAAGTFVAHGGAGIAGAIAFPLFVSPALGGPGFDQGIGLLTQMTAQGVAVLAVVLWTALVTAVAALMVAMVAPMRPAGSTLP